MSDTENKNEELVDSPEEAKGKEAKKVEAEFQQNKAVLLDLFEKSPASLKGRKKINKDRRGELMDEVYKEEIEAAEINFKTKAKGLIKSSIAFDSFKEQKEREFQDAMTAKKKEMNKEMKDCFAILEGVEEIKKKFLASVPKKGDEKA